MYRYAKNGSIGVCLYFGKANFGFPQLLYKLECYRCWIHRGSDTAACFHAWLGPVCAFCQVIEVGNNLVGRIVRRQPDPSPIVTSQIMTPIFAQKIVKLQAPSHHPPASGWIPPLLSTHPVTNLLKVVAWAQALHSSDWGALTHIIISVLYNHSYTARHQKFSILGCAIHTSGDSVKFWILEPGSSSALREHGHETPPIALTSLWCSNLKWPPLKRIAILIYMFSYLIIRRNSRIFAGFKDLWECHCY